MNPVNRLTRRIWSRPLKRAAAQPQTVRQGLMHPEYAGMTVNERLFTAGLLEAWDTAARRRDRGEMIRLLRSVEIGTLDAPKIVETILANPTKYGF